MTMPDSVAARTRSLRLPRAAQPGAATLLLPFGAASWGAVPIAARGRCSRAYLRVAPRCPVCHEDLSPQRADDAPAYLTLLIVCHVVGAGVLLSDEILPNAPLIVAISFWLAATALMSLLILPRMKGAVVGYQWALRMHGFGSPSPEISFSASLTQSTPLVRPRPMISKCRRRPARTCPVGVTPRERPGTSHPKC